MPVPDNTYFGEKPEGGGIHYKEVREIQDDQRSLLVLKSRVDTLLIRQVNELSIRNEDGGYKIWSPFALAVLTFLAIETVGHIITNVEKIKAENDNEQSKLIVTPVYQLMDKNLSYKPSKKFYEGFEKLHGREDKKSIKRYSDVIHKYQRNTFNHGYQGRGVYLSHEPNEPWIIQESEGYLIINPYLFWGLCKNTYESVFEQILKKQNEEWRRNALQYLNHLLS